MDKLSFWLVYLTTMMGYLSKYYIYKLLIYLFKVSEDYTKYNGNSDLANNSNNITNNTNDIIINNNITINNTIINGKINLINAFKMRIDEKYIFLILCAIYIFFILLSIILYSIFKFSIFENKNNKEFKYNKYCCICKIFFKIVNYVFYIEKIEVKNSKKTKNCKLCGETINNYCSNVCANSIGLICPNKIKEFKCKCCNCCEYNEEDYDKDTQYFCYCYQEKGFCEWLDKFITNYIQKEIIPSMVLYFLSMLVTIGSEEYFKKRNENLDIDQGNFIFSFILTFFLYFGLITFNRIIIENNICYCNLENIFYKVLKSIYHEPFYILTIITCFGFMDSIEYLKNYYYINIYQSIIVNKIFFFRLIIILQVFQKIMEKKN